MSQLILLRQRIKAIETIKKITHAMRLISMSSHTHLRNNKGSFESYTLNLKHLLAKIKIIAPINNENLSKKNHNEKILLCVVSSQKGLCGTFNSNLINFFKNYITSFDQSNVSLFLVGKKIIDNISRDYSHQIINTEPNFSLRTMPHILKKLQSIMKSFDRVIVIHNKSKTFFSQKTQASIVTPLELNDNHTSSDTFGEYQWEINPETVFDTLFKEYTHAYLEHLLLESLLAEHAARFIAMDNSTRNAHTLLEEKKIEYNKLRQAKITKELTELSGIFTL